MYRYVVKSGGSTKCDIFSDGMKRARILAKTLFPDSDVQVEKFEDRSGLCPGCGTTKKSDMKCGCWGYS